MSIKERLTKCYNEVTTLQEQIAIARDEYEKVKQEYEAKFAEYRVGDRVCIPPDQDEWEVRMVRVGVGGHHRIWYTIHKVGDMSGVATVLGEHLTKL